jgi:MFS family permease
MATLREGMNRNIALLTLTSLCADISTEMIYPVLPFFLTGVLRAPATVLGLIEGVAEGIQYGIQGPAGWLADRTGRKKPLGAIGYTLAAIGKPIIGLALVWPIALLGRALDRLGAGIRSAPRDALIAGSAARGHRALAFGFEGVGDHAGAFMGPLIALLLISVLQLPMRGIFLLAFIPGALALLLFLLVRERRQDSDRSAGQEGDEVPARHRDRSSSARLSLQAADPAYWRYLLVTALFGVGNSTNAFLLLRLQGIGAVFTTTLLVYALFNLVAALVSAPAGALADHLGSPKWVLFGCFLLFAVVYLGFALGKAYAADLVPAAVRASGLGWYATVVGLSSLVASLVGGWLWTNVAPAATFVYGAAFALVAGLALALLIPGRRRADTPGVAQNGAAA